ncbi:MAG TPA: lectin subunit beta, partial [Tahibacter sp.]|nr:lectin subunit beta [Tahibacter sp.]
SLVERGLPAVLSQTFRTLLQSRMQASLSKYRSHYANADVVLFEPNADDARMFFTNVFSYDNRLQVAEHAYRSTLSDLRARRSELEPVFARHGLSFDSAVLDDTQRGLRAGIGPAPAPQTPATAQLRRALDELQALVAPEPRRRPHKVQRVHS